jgi:hypothetical protein
MNAEDRQCLKRFWWRKELLLTIATGITLATFARGTVLHNQTNSLEQQLLVSQVSQSCSEKFPGDTEHFLREIETTSNFASKLESEGELKAALVLRESVDKCVTEFNVAVKRRQGTLRLLYSDMMFLQRMILMNLGLLSIFFFYSLLGNSYFLRWSGHLLLPEEIIGELIALKHRRQKQSLPVWKLYLELATEVLLLLWAVHVQVRLQNIRLEPSKKRKID